MINQAIVLIKSKRSESERVSLSEDGESLTMRGTPAAKDGGDEDASPQFCGYCGAGLWRG
jgi:hypothetical protein